MLKTLRWDVDSGLTKHTVVWPLYLWPISLFACAAAHTGGHPLLQRLLLLQCAAWSRIVQQSSGMAVIALRAGLVCALSVVLSSLLCLPPPHHSLPTSPPPFRDGASLCGRLSVCVCSNHSHWLCNTTMAWIHPFSFLMQSLHQKERQRLCLSASVRVHVRVRVCCRSKSPLPCFCCMYYAIYFRSLIRSASWQSTMWEWRQRERGRAKERDRYVIYRRCGRLRQRRVNISVMRSEGPI